MTVNGVRYFFLNDFTGNCLSIDHQKRYQKQEGCDVAIAVKGSGKGGDRIYAHSQVLKHWSTRFTEIIEQVKVKRAISPESPLVTTISSSDFGTIKLLIDMIYYGSACVPGQAVSEFLKQGEKMRLKLREETAVVTPNKTQNTKRLRPGTPAILRAPSRDSGYESMPVRRRIKKGRRDEAKQGEKRKHDDRMSHEEEEGPCKRICKKSEIENQIQLSPGSERFADQGCDLLDLSIVPTIDSD